MQSTPAAAAPETGLTGRAKVHRPSPRPALRPLVLPTEHGGWGFLFEPVILGLAVAPSAAGALVGLAALLGFLTRQPLKLAMQDALRGRSYPRTKWCRAFAAAYLLGAVAALAGAVMAGSTQLLVPFAIVSPLAVIALVHDARNRSRAAVAEYAGSIAMASTAAAIVLASGGRPFLAFAASALIVLRGVPTITFVRTLLARAHGQSRSASSAVALHAIAIATAWLLTHDVLCVVATATLLIRALWTLTRPPLAAKTLGWREIAWGAFSVAMFAAGLR